MAAAAILPGAAQAETKRYFSHTAVCGGESEIVSLSNARPHRLCDPAGRRCQNYQLYQYQVRCPNGRLHSGAEVSRSAAAEPHRIRIEGDTLYVATGERITETRQCDPGLDPHFCQQIKQMYGRKEVAWEPFPAGYAPLPHGAHIVERAVAPSRPAADPGPAPPVGLILLLIGLGLAAAFRWKWLMTQYYLLTMPDPSEQLVRTAIAQNRAVDGPALADAIRRATTPGQREPAFVTEARIRRAEATAARMRAHAETAEAAVRHTRARRATEREADL